MTAAGYFVHRPRVAVALAEVYWLLVALCTEALA